MKNILNKFLIIIVTLFSVMNVFAVPNPPAPNAKKPPPPPGLPIDDNISVLLIMGMLLGVYIMYKYQLKTKAPIV